MKIFVFALLNFGLTTVLCQLPREFVAREAARECIAEYKLSYNVAFKYSLGDFSDDSHDAKCFLKCFAYKVGFFNATGDFQKEELMEYVHYIVPDHIPASLILDKCSTPTLVEGEDQCDYVFRAYKCFWDGIRSDSGEVVRGFPFSFYDALGFDLLYAEEEVDLKTNE